MSHLQIITFTIILLVLVGFAAFFSCAETGLMAINRYRLRHQARMKNQSAMRLQRLLRRPDKLLSAILIGNTFANMLASSLATLLALHFWGEHGALLAAAVLTLIVLIFAEIIPKTLAAIYSEQVARKLALAIQIILFILYPIVWLATVVTNGFLRLLRLPVTQWSTEPLSRDELRTMIYDTTAKMPRRYQDMLLGILDLNKLTVDDVMISRYEMVGLNIEAGVQQMLTQLKACHSEWIPVYRGQMNQLIGVLSMYDLMRCLLSHTHLTYDVIDGLLQQPHFVLEGTSLATQLKYFQKHHDKLAFVVDEYGDVQGQLTLNDILEEIVGDFTSHLSLSKRIKEQPDGSYLVEGAVSVREFNRVSGYDLPLGIANTVSGLIVDFLQMLPHTGIAVLIASYPIEIMQVKDNRVKIAKVFPKIHQEESL